MHPVRPHLLDRGGPCNRLIGSIARHCRRVGLDARLRRVLLVVASYRNHLRTLDGWEAVAGTIALEAAYRIARRRLDAPERALLRSGAPES